MGLFGTDGIRGIYNKELFDRTAYGLGKAFCRTIENPIIVIGRDSRESGERLTSALCSGIYENGGEIINVGIIPTNGVSYFTRYYKADYGVMITASHNPPDYNGLKVFDGTGVKLSRNKENKLEDYIKDNNVIINSDIDIPTVSNCIEQYIDYVAGSVPVNLNFKIALDCCYGCAAGVADKVFNARCPSVTAINNIHNGKLINVNCGATTPDCLSRYIKDKDFDLGFSFDGDADRLAVFEKDYVDNNVVFYCMAKYLKEKNLLKNNIVVGTILTNSGLERALNSLGIKLLRSDVGDRNVYEMMLKSRASLGGEDSGHYIFGDCESGSDALLNALFISKIKKECGSLTEYSRELRLMPSKNLNIPVDSSFVLADFLAKNIIERLMKDYPSCRCVIRRSGTESILRLLIEADNDEYAQNALFKLKDIIDELKAKM